jgi:HK97 family phage major capsid protein
MLKAKTAEATAPVFMAVSIESLRTKVQAVIAEIETINAKADEEERDLTDDEMGVIEARSEEIENLNRQIAARQKAADATAAVNNGVGRRTAPEPRNADAPARIYPSPRDPKGGFKNFGDFAMQVRRATIGDQEVMTRLQNASSTWSGENVGADGGFAVPPEFRTEIAIKIMGPDSLLSMTDKLVTSSNSITIPKDENAPWDQAAGIRAYWENEGQTIPPSKIALDQSTIRLNKLTALVPVSDELLEDAAGIDSYLRTKAPQKMIAKLNTAIINGTGVGQPAGIVGAASAVTVAAKSGQGANTVIFPNIIDMWTSLYAQWRRNAVWLINQDVEAQLNLMVWQTAGTIPAGTSPIPVFLPGNTIAGNGYDTLKGRPVIPCEACPALGSAGDIILVDLNQYMTATKGQDIKTDVSIHLYFDQDLTAYRFIFRVAGQPWWTAPITPQNSAKARTWAVMLNANRT